MKNRIKFMVPSGKLAPATKPAPIAAVNNQSVLKVPRMVAAHPITTTAALEATLVKALEKGLVILTTSQRRKVAAKLLTLVGQIRRNADELEGVNRRPRKPFFGFTLTDYKSDGYRNMAKCLGVTQRMLFDFALGCWAEGAELILGFDVVKASRMTPRQVREQARRIAVVKKAAWHGGNARRN